MHNIHKHRNTSQISMLGVGSDLSVGRGVCSPMYFCDLNGVDDINNQIFWPIRIILAHNYRGTVK